METWMTLKFLTIQKLIHWSYKDGKFQSVGKDSYMTVFSLAKIPMKNNTIWNGPTRAALSSDFVKLFVQYKKFQIIMKIILW